ncbi:hypothetical protein Q3G72_023563 [Acer saccharum]|nr:hypothetical protein Q3G72_023563 [Acer saccharum]
MEEGEVEEELEKEETMESKAVLPKRKHGRELMGGSGSHGRQAEARQPSPHVKTHPAVPVCVCLHERWSESESINFNDHLSTEPTS